MDFCETLCIPLGWFGLVCLSSEHWIYNSGFGMSVAYPLVMHVFISHIGFAKRGSGLWLHILWLCMFYIKHWIYKSGFGMLVAYPLVMHVLYNTMNLQFGFRGVGCISSGHAFFDIKHWIYKSGFGIAVAYPLVMHFYDPL